MITPNLLLITCCSSLFVLLQTSHANPHDCKPSSCGSIHNISSPFRLKDSPKHSGDSKYELACQNNVTFIDLNSQKYKVKAINYNNFTIRVAHVSININSTCSFPHFSLYHYNFRSDYPYSNQDEMGHFVSGEGYPDLAWPINFMSCPYPLKNSSLFTEVTRCVNGENVFEASNSSSSRHTYIKVGHMNVSDVKHMCSVDLIVLTSWKFEDFNNVSLSEIHNSLMYGFELSWFYYYYHPFSGLSAGITALIVILVLIIVVLVAGVTVPAKSIIAFTILLVILISINWEWPFTFDHFAEDPLIFLEYLLLFIGFSSAAKNIILFPCVMGLLIYKFRRRHLSMFDGIEDFLQSDNKLMPIRYSYSDIKRMTRGFQEKLGQGGYGSVYKGKRRSGHYVAVKLLEKPRANGQDFMNEIATIGRIHHVNVVKLVGYCAERSKRALVYDFMPNGSLEKYIFSREKMNSLNWKRKFEIAVGVARGIEYLHRGCDIQILHFDIKPHNILLDDKFIPKVSDFGLAKFCSTDKKTVTLTAARGTIGYVAPELINRGIGGVSQKADVYSFGMLLIDMVGVKKDLLGNNENSSQYFPYWIYDCFNQGKDIEIEITDENNDDDDNDTRRKIARKMTIVALWCIQMSPDDRPSMNKVLEMLEGQVERLRIPHRPSHSPQIAVNRDESWSTFSTDSVSLLCHDAAPSLEIIVEDLQSL